MSSHIPEENTDQDTDGGGDDPIQRPSSCCYIMWGLNIE